MGWLERAPIATFLDLSAGHRGSHDASILAQPRNVHAAFGD